MKAFVRHLYHALICDRCGEENYPWVWFCSCCGKAFWKKSNTKNDRLSTAGKEDGHGQ